MPFNYLFYVLVMNWLLLHDFADNYAAMQTHPFWSIACLVQVSRSKMC